MTTQPKQNIIMSLTVWIFLILGIAVTWDLFFLGLGALAHITWWLLCYGWNFF